MPDGVKLSKIANDCIDVGIIEFRKTLPGHDNDPSAVFLNAGSYRLGDL